MSLSGSPSERMLARRPSSPLYSTHSRYQATMRLEIATMEKRLPSRHALIKAASVMPTTGTSRASRRPGTPGSPNAGAEEPATGLIRRRPLHDEAAERLRDMIVEG